MKSYLHPLRLFGLALLTMSLSAASTHAQRLQIANLPKLEAKAVEIVDVTIDERMLQLGARSLNAKDPEQAKVKQIVAGLKGVYVRSFEFEKEGEYSPEDVEALRAQVRGPVKVVSKRGGDNIEVSLMTEGDRVLGLAIIAAEPKELTVVNIVGPIDLDKLVELEGNFGIPRFGIQTTRKSDRSDKKDQ